MQQVRKLDWVTYSCLLSQHKFYKQIRRIVVTRPATTLTLKKVKGQGQGHGMVSIEKACHNDHACQISMLYL